MATSNELNGFAGDGGFPLAPDEETGAFAAGTPAKHPFGVLYQGEHETVWDGTATAVRLHARALDAVGVPVVLRSFSNKVITESGIPEPVTAAGLPEVVRREVGDLRDTSIAVTVPMIKHAVVASGMHVRGLVLPRGAVHHDIDTLMELRSALYRATILYTVWERDRIDNEIAVQMARVAQCWVPCTQNREMLIAAGVDAERVHVVPHPYDPANPLCRLTARKPTTVRRFYTVGRWEPRKDQHLLIGAFLTAFRPGEAKLAIKYSGDKWEGYPTPEQSIDYWLRGKRVDPAWTRKAFSEDVTMLGKRVQPDQILKLHFENNIYVNASHGEAWCIPAHDAKVAGNRLVHVNYGGTADFAGDGDITVPWKLGLAHNSYKWEESAQWARYKVEDLAAALHEADAPSTHARAPGFAERYELRNVGRLMLKRVLEVADDCAPAAAAYFREQTEAQSQ